MAKLLKLKQLKSYISPATRSTVVNRGDVCKFTDAMAERLGKMTVKDRENVDISVWAAQPAGTACVHDFSNREDENKGVPGVDPSVPAERWEEPTGDEPVGDTDGNTENDNDEKTPVTPPPAAKAAPAKTAAKTSPRARQRQAR